MNSRVTGLSLEITVALQRVILGVGVGRMGEGGHKVQTSRDKTKKLWVVMYSMVVIVNSIVVYIPKLLREILKIRITRIKEFGTV